MTQYVNTLQVKEQQQRRKHMGDHSEYKKELAFQMCSGRLFQRNGARWAKA